MVWNSSNNRGACSAIILYMFVVFSPICFDLASMKYYRLLDMSFIVFSPDERAPGPIKICSLQEKKGKETKPELFVIEKLVEACMGIHEGRSPLLLCPSSIIM